MYFWRFLRVAVPSAVFVAGLAAIALGQYTNWPNGSGGTTVGSLFLSSVVSSPPGNYTSGQIQPTTQDTSGFLNVHCQSGCSAASDPANGPVNPGSAASNSKLAGLVFNSSAPTLGNGQQASLQGDVSGNLDVNVQKLNDPALGSVTGGTAGTSSKLIGGIFNSSAPTLANGEQASAQLDASGNIKVDIAAGGAAGGTSSGFASAFPSTGTAIGVKNGSNMVNLTADSGSNLNVDCVTGCNAASDTSNGTVAPGTAATTSKLGGLVFNSAAPTLSNSQQAALQGDNHGDLFVAVNSSLPTGSNVVGQVGGTTTGVSVTPTVTASSAYTSGFCVGGLETFAGAARTGGPGSGLIQSAVVTDVSGQDANMDLVIFNANPTNSTFTDHAQCTVNNADLSKIKAIIHITDCALLGSSAPGMCQAQQQAVPYGLGSGNTTLYAVLITRGTPTYTATSNITTALGFLQD